MADTAGIFEKNFDYRSKYIKKYSRKANIPSVSYLDVKFHPTLLDHVIVLSSMTLPNINKIQTLVPEDTVIQMQDEINNTYFAQAERIHADNKQKPIVISTNQKAPDEDIPQFHINEGSEEDMEGGSSLNSNYAESEESENESEGEEDKNEVEGEENEQEVEAEKDEEEVDEEISKDADESKFSPLNAKETKAELKQRK